MNDKLRKENSGKVSFSEKDFASKKFFEGAGGPDPPMERPVSPGIQVLLAKLNPLIYKNIYKFSKKLFFKSKTV